MTATPPESELVTLASAETITPPNSQDTLVSSGNINASSPTLLTNSQILQSLSSHDLASSQDVSPSGRKRGNKKDEGLSSPGKQKRQRLGYSPKSTPKNEMEGELWKLKLPELRECLKTAAQSTTGNKDQLIVKVLTHVDNDPVRLRDLLNKSSVGQSLNISASSGSSQSQSLSQSSQDIYAHNVQSDGLTSAPYTDTAAAELLDLHNREQ